MGVLVESVLYLRANFLSQKAVSFILNYTFYYSKLKISAFFFVRSRVDRVALPLSRDQRNEIKRGTVIVAEFRKEKINVKIFIGMSEKKNE